MRVLLLKPISETYYVIQPNLGLGYIASILLRNGYEVEILDAGKERLTWEEFTERIGREKYDLIGIQMFTHEVMAVKRHVEIIRRESARTAVLIGGSHISGDPVGTMKLIDADYGLVGEGELGMENFFRPTNAENIPNLVWRNHRGEVVVNKRVTFLDLDDIKFPAWHLMPPSEYPTAPHGGFCKHPPVAPMIVSRGCPFQCTFCAGHCITGRRIRYRSIENVLQEIKLLRDQYGVREIHIEDDCFTLKRDYVVKFCEAVKDLGLAFACPNGVRLDTLDEDLLRLMERAGFYSLAVGIESGSDRVLRLMKKQQTVETVREKVALIKRCTKIRLTGFFMLGYPGETEAEIEQTIALSRSLKIDKASFMFVMPLPGSELWTDYKAEHPSVDCEKFFYYRIVPGLSEIAPKRLKQLQRCAVLGFYLRPRILLSLLREIRTRTQFMLMVKRCISILFKTL